MATKLIRFTILLFVFGKGLIINAQDQTVLQLNDISIDNIPLKNARYNIIEFGKIINEISWIEELEDYSRNFNEKTYDSIVVLSFTTCSNKRYINWIKIVGQSHLVNIRNNLFRINDSISSLSNNYPTIYEDYLKYLGKNPRPLSIIHFGIPVEIFTKEAPSESYFGAIKFGIYEGIIKEILIDLRPEGEFD